MTSPVAVHYDLETILPRAEAAHAKQLQALGLKKLAKRLEKEVSDECRAIGKIRADALRNILPDFEYGVTCPYTNTNHYTLYSTTPVDNEFFTHMFGISKREISNWADFIQFNIDGKIKIMVCSNNTRGYHHIPKSIIPEPEGHIDIGGSDLVSLEKFVKDFKIRIVSIEDNVNKYVRQAIGHKE